MLILAFFINMVQVKNYFKEEVIAKNWITKEHGESINFKAMGNNTCPPLCHAGNKVGPRSGCMGQVKADTAGVRRSKSDLSKTSLKYWDTSFTPNHVRIKCRNSKGSTNHCSKLHHTWKLQQVFQQWIKDCVLCLLEVCMLYSE